jgi:hypothetical protein
VELILERFLPDGLAAPTSTLWVTTLVHEVADDAIEDDAVVLARLHEPSKVLAGLGRLPGVELDGDVALDCKGAPC